MPTRDATAMLTLTISCLFLSVVVALPTLLSRDVYDPPITSPTASTVWQVGQTVTVSWDTTNLPPASQLTDPNGTVVLGYMTSPTDSEHLMLDPPLAQDFPLSDGKVSFTVPSVVTRTDYIIALFGDSGNISPTFTIQGSDSSSSSALSTTTSATPTSTSTSISPSTFTSSPTTQSTVTEAEASSSQSTSASEVSVINTITSVVTVSSVTASSMITTDSASTLSTSNISGSLISATSSASSSSSTEAASASSNAARKSGASQNQVYAFIITGLFVACLL
ncbi:hypothetical protein J3R30DRAFT_3455516 [Lentinula aciculospora]|uniref:Yeast cell wall synthesis Kre9/Knh1-like N-terminal domain-containing protein n=1 Tax=Lentinula aciculospora TaxID=153920 RepID=A0A9W9AHF5_9AGAR|nr:hypothetical protein J3R30DRAFT_3455516 [Lentinula aciculospora]